MLKVESKIPFHNKALAELSLTRNAKILKRATRRYGSGDELGLHAFGVTSSAATLILSLGGATLFSESLPAGSHWSLEYRVIRQSANYIAITTLFHNTSSRVQVAAVADFDAPSISGVVPLHTSTYFTEGD